MVRGSMARRRAKRAGKLGLRKSALSIVDAGIETLGLTMERPYDLDVGD